MLPEYFALVSTVVVSLGTLQYLWLTLRGEVQPNRLTFFFWGLFPLIIYFAQSSLDVSGVLWITLSVGVLPFAIIVASYVNPSAHWNMLPRDYLLGVMAIIAMVLWYVTDDPLIAIYFALVADLLAGLPTLIKCYTSPQSEDWRPYALNAFGFLIGLLSVQQWVVAEYAFVAYLFLMTALFSLVIVVRQQQVEQLQDCK